MLAVSATAACTIPDQYPASSSKILPLSFAFRADRAAAPGIALGVNLYSCFGEGVKEISDLLSEMGAIEVLGEHPDAFVLGLDHARSLATDS